MTKFTVTFISSHGTYRGGTVEAATPEEAVVRANGPTLEGTQAIVLHDGTVKVFVYTDGWRVDQKSDTVAQMFARAGDLMKNLCPVTIVDGPGPEERVLNVFGDPSLCGCHACRDARESPEESLMRIMVLCPKCGNKRCPKASDHRNECTNSNEPGQPGSIY